MFYHVFFTCYSRNEVVPSSHPQPMDGKSLQQLLVYCLREEDDFIGVVDKEGVVLEFILTATGTILAEIPNVKAHSSLQRYLSLEEALTFLEKLPVNLSALDLSSFAWAAWPTR